MGEGEGEGVGGGRVVLGVLDEGEVGEKAGVGMEIVALEGGEGGVFMELAGEADGKGREEDRFESTNEEQGGEAAAEEEEVKKDEEGEKRCEG